jgi:hypothetical protein
MMDCNGRLRTMRVLNVDEQCRVMIDGEGR